MSYALYLDDERTPRTERGWVIVRSFDAFEAVLSARGLPEIVSFDHDLGEERSGMDCARLLVDLAMEQGVSLDALEWNVHSANPVGAENIRSLFRSAIRFQREHGV